MRAFLYRYEFLPIIKNDLVNGIKYLDKNGVMGTAQLKDEVVGIAKKLLKMDKFSMILGTDLISKNKAKLQGLEVLIDVCEMLGYSDTSNITREIVNDDFINEFLNYKRDQEIERNKVVARTKKGYISFMYQHLDDYDHLMSNI